MTDEQMLRQATRFPTDGEINVAFADYSHFLGRVVHSWNRLHERLAELFAVVMGGSQRVALAVWHSSLNDRAQRNMLETAVKTVSDDRWERKFPQAKTDLIWPIAEINSLSAHRDNAVHAPAVLTINDRHIEMAAIQYTQHKRAKNLVGKELLVEFDYYARKSDAYGDFTGSVSACLQLYNYASWPDRPPQLNRRPKTALLGLRLRYDAK
jgi:hypothetical protein